MARGKAQVRGLKQVQRNMMKLGNQGAKAFRGAVYAEGLYIMDKAAPNVPKATGRLANSHFVSWPDFTGKVVIGFGAIYAAAVEYGLKLVNASRRQQRAAFANMRETGWTKSAVGGPGFFRNAINSTRGGRVARIAKTAKRYFKMDVGFQPSPAIPNKSKG